MVTLQIKIEIDGFVEHIGPVPVLVGDQRIELAHLLALDQETDRLLGHKTSPSEAILFHKIPTLLLQDDFSPGDSKFFEPNLDSLAVKPINRLNHSKQER
jgi:hypothetical protein